MPSTSRMSDLFFFKQHGHERVEALGIASTYLVGMKESGNQKYNFSYLANTKGLQKISY